MLLTQQIKIANTLTVVALFFLSNPRASSKHNQYGTLLEIMHVISSLVCADPHASSTSVSFKSYCVGILIYLNKQTNQNQQN